MRVLLSSAGLLSSLVGVVEGVLVENTPLTKVVHLLQGMQEQIKKEATQDELIYSKLDCWCKTNRKEKQENIADATEQIALLEARIVELTGNKGELAADIERLQKEINDNEESLAQMEALEEKRAKKAHEQEKDYVETTTQLKAAITILSKHNADLEPALAQTESELSQVQSILAKITQTLVSAEDKQTLTQLLQARPYASQSAEIFGFLKQMLETMEADLASLRAEAASALALYNDTHNAKKSELAAQRSDLEHKQDLFGSGAVELAQSKKELRETKESLDADQKFLVSLEKRCSSGDKEINARREARAEELSVLQKTVEILMTDGSRDLSKKTMTSSFTQSSTSFTQLNAAATANSKRSLLAQYKYPASLLASTTQLDSFTVVKQAINKLIADLKTKQAAEVTKRDSCVSSLDRNEAETLSANHEKEDLAAKVEELGSKISALQVSIGKLKTEISEDQIELQKATVARVAESKEYEQVYQDYSAMQDILHSAILTLKKFYNEPRPSLLALKNKQDPPSETLEKGGYSKQASSVGAITLIEEIMNDQKKALTLAVQAEQESQQSYESFVAETNTSVTKKQAVIVSTSDALAGTKEAFAETKGDQRRNMQHLEKLDSIQKSLHEECTFLLSNFDVRQESRATEIEALQQSIQILSGAIN